MKKPPSYKPAADKTAVTGGVPQKVQAGIPVAGSAKPAPPETPPPLKGAFANLPMGKSPKIIAPKISISGLKGRLGGLLSVVTSPVSAKALAKIKRAAPKARLKGPLLGYGGTLLAGWYLDYVQRKAQKESYERQMNALESKVKKVKELLNKELFRLHSNIFARAIRGRSSMCTQQSG